MPASVLTISSVPGLDQRIAARLLQVQDAPAVDRVARDVRWSRSRVRGSRSPGTPGSRAACADRSLPFRSPSRLLPVVVLPVVRPSAGRVCAAGPASAHRSANATHDAQDARSPEAVAPAEGGDQSRHDDKREPLADGVRRAPDAVVAAALAVAEPVGERHDARGRAEALEPAVERPERDRYGDGPSKSPCRR